VDLGHYFATQPAAFAAIASVFGLAVGSFLNVVIYRLPVMLERSWRQQCQELAGKPSDSTEASERFSLAYPPSRCPQCGHRITAVENIPVLSYVVQRGRCRHCQGRISARYPIVELLAGAMAALVAWNFGYGFVTLAALVLVWSLIALTFIDYDHQLLPDNITLPLLWVGLLVNINATFVPLTSAVIGAAGGYAFLFTVYHLFKLLTGKEGMGFGDFKLFATFGAWLGWKALPLIILFASLVGALTGLAFILLFGRDRNLPIPFGPFLCVSAVIVLLWGDTITHSYLDYARLRP